jgi:hypothetical protein
MHDISFQYPVSARAAVSQPCFKPSFGTRFTQGAKITYADRTVVILEMLHQITN